MDILTANELISGATVYLDAGGHWQMDINKARVFGDEEGAALEAAIAAAKATGRLIGVESEKVDLVDGKVVAKRLRERIRAEGPTAPYDNRRQVLDQEVITS
jgi:hypothetical protein